MTIPARNMLYRPIVTQQDIDTVRAKVVGGPLFVPAWPLDAESPQEDGRTIIMLCGAARQALESGDDVWEVLDAIERRAALIVEKLEGKPL